MYYYFNAGDQLGQEDVQYVQKEGQKRSAAEIRAFIAANPEAAAIMGRTIPRGMKDLSPEDRVDFAATAALTAAEKRTSATENRAALEKPYTEGATEIRRVVAMKANTDIAVYKPITEIIDPLATLSRKEVVLSAPPGTTKIIELNQEKIDTAIKIEPQNPPQRKITEVEKNADNLLAATYGTVRVGTTDMNLATIVDNFVAHTVALKFEDRKDNSTPSIFNEGELTDDQKAAKAGAILEADKARKQAFALAIKVYMLQNPELVPAMLASMQREYKPGEPMDLFSKLSAKQIAEIEVLTKRIVVQKELDKQLTLNRIDIAQKATGLLTIAQEKVLIVDTIRVPTVADVAKQQELRQAAAEWTRKDANLYKGIFPGRPEMMAQLAEIAKKNPDKVFKIIAVMTQPGLNMQKMEDPTILERHQSVELLTAELSKLGLKGREAKALLIQLKEMSSPDTLQTIVYGDIIARVISQLNLTRSEASTYATEVKRALATGDFRTLDKIISNLQFIGADSENVRGNADQLRKAIHAYQLLRIEQTITELNSRNRADALYLALSQYREVTDAQTSGHITQLFDTLLFAQNKAKTDRNYEGDPNNLAVTLLWGYLRQRQQVTLTETIANANTSEQRTTIAQALLGKDRYDALDQEAKQRVLSQIENSAKFTREQLKRLRRIPVITSLNVAQARVLMSFITADLQESKYDINNEEFGKKFTRRLQLAGITGAPQRTRILAHRMQTRLDGQLADIHGTGALLMINRDAVVRAAYPEAEKSDKINRDVLNFANSIGENMNPAERAKLLSDITLLQKPTLRNALAADLPKTFKRVVISSAISVAGVAVIASAPISGPVLTTFMVVGTLVSGVMSARKMRESANSDGGDTLRARGLRWSSAAFGAGSTFLAIGVGVGLGPIIGPAAVIGIRVASELLMHTETSVIRHKGEIRAYHRLTEAANTHRQQMESMLEQLSVEELTALEQKIVPAVGYAERGNVRVQIDPKKQPKRSKEELIHSIMIVRGKFASEQQASALTASTKAIYTAVETYIAANETDDAKPKPMSDIYTKLNEAFTQAKTQVKTEIDKATNVASGCIAAYNLGRAITAIGFETQPFLSNMGVLPNQSQVAFGLEPGNNLGVQLPRFDMTLTGIVAADRLGDQTTATVQIAAGLGLVTVSAIGSGVNSIKQGISTGYTNVRTGITEKVESARSRARMARQSLKYRGLRRPATFSRI